MDYLIYLYTKILKSVPLDGLISFYHKDNKKKKKQNHFALERVHSTFAISLQHRADRKKSHIIALKNHPIK